MTRLPSNANLSRMTLLGWPAEGGPGPRCRRDGSVVELRQAGEDGVPWVQSAVDLADPPRQVLVYTRLLFAGALFTGAPRSALALGLGGGAFHRLFAAAFPAALLETVECNPAVLELAAAAMEFRAGPRCRVTILDGRQFLRETGRHWDWVILDAFQAGEIPRHLRTAEFYGEAAARLAPGGVLVSNLHSGHRLYPADVCTLAHVFPELCFFQAAGRGNVIAVAARTRRLGPAELAAGDPAAAGPVLNRYLDLHGMKASLVNPRPEAERFGRVLRDADFPPAGS